MALNYQGEQHFGLLSPPQQVAQVVYHQQIVIVQLPERPRQIEVVFGLKHILHQAVRRDEQHGSSSLHGLDSARSLTGARYGAITLVDDSLGLQDVFFSGVTEQEARQFRDMQGGERVGYILLGEKLGEKEGWQKFT